MATDPSMLQSWYNDYTKAQPDVQTATAAPTAEAAATTGGMLNSTQAPAAPGAFTPAQASTTNWAPDANSTVAGQVAKITDAGGPLMDRATTRAAQQVNSRGLLNSSLGITAGQTALYDAALPMATQDASTFASAGQFNANAGNQTSQFNANATNEAGMQQAGFAQQTTLQDKDFAQQNKTQAADLASRYDLAKMDVQSRAALQEADIANQQKLQQANAALQTGLQATDNAVKQSMQAYDAALKTSMQGLDNANKLALATMDADNRVALAGIEAKYKNELQASQSMAASYQSMVDSFTRVMLDKDLDSGGKQGVIDNLTTLYDNTLKMQSDVSTLNLGTLLGAPGPAAPAPTVLTPVAATAAAPAPAAAPVFDDYWGNPGGA